MSEALRKAPLFECFQASEIEKIAARLERRTFAAGQVAIEEGTAGDALHVILDGLFKVTRTDAMSGATQMLATFGKGEIFGETALLIDSPRAARVTAIVDGETLAMTRPTFEAILVEFPGSAAKFLRQIARTTIERLRKSLGEVIAATGFDPEARETEYHLLSLVREKRTVKLHLAGGLSLSGKILRQIRGIGSEEIVLEVRKDEEAIVPIRSIVFYEVAPKK